MSSAKLVQAVEALSALAHEGRLSIYRLLVRAGAEGLAAGRIAQKLDVLPNTLSANLNVLANAGLVESRRDGRSIIYSADYERMTNLLGFLMEDCCNGNVSICGPLASIARKGEAMDRKYNVLFLCTGNSARSILAEAILNRVGKDRFNAYSAGSHPKGQVHPEALALLKRLDHPTDGLRSKPWDEFAKPDSPPLDFVITVCDQAAGEVCPVWPGQPMSAHWGMPDPAAAQGSKAEIAAQFADTYRMLNNRIGAFANLKMSGLDKLSLQNKVRDIGRLAP